MQICNYHASFHHKDETYFDSIYTVSCDYVVPVETNPSCLHTTTASFAPQESSQTVPHTLLLQISTRPSVIAVPPTSRKAPLVVELHVWAATKKRMNIIPIIVHNIHSIAKIAMN